MGGMKDQLGDTPWQSTRPPPPPPPRSGDAAREAKAESMQQVEENANEVWKRTMYELVVRVARMKPRFTSDDVFDLYDQTHQTAWTHELRAFGPVMMRAAKNEVCRKADCAPVNSRRVSLHASPRAVWDSLIFGK